MAVVHDHAYLVGSMALPSVKEVFRMTGDLLGSRLNRVPDGEPGGRNLFVSWQYPLLRANPFLAVDRSYEPSARTGFLKLKIADGVSPGEIRFGELGYAREARTSYADFVRARDKGELPSHCRFQVCLPTPIGVLLSFITPEALFQVERAYKDAFVAEVDQLCEEIPHKDLTIQWDVCWEMILWERNPAFPAPWPNEALNVEVISRIEKLCEQVPADVELGFHLCYGDWEARHFIEPRDATAMVEIGNALTTTVKHAIGYIHFPVPIGRADDQFFKPFDELHLAPNTEIYVGLVHLSDGVDGARKRLTAAQRHLPNIAGIATECGLGRCKTPDVVKDILTLHTRILTAS